MTDKLTPPNAVGSLEGLDTGQRHMRVEAALSKLVQDFPNSGYKALFDVQKKIATPTQIDILSQLDRAMATPDGKLTELGSEAFDSAQKKINDILSADYQKALLRRNIEVDSALEAVKKQEPTHTLDNNKESLDAITELSKATVNPLLTPTLTIANVPSVATKEAVKNLPGIKKQSIPSNYGYPNKSIKKDGPEIG